MHKVMIFYFSSSTEASVIHSGRDLPCYKSTNYICFKTKPVRLLTRESANMSFDQSGFCLSVQALPDGLKTQLRISMLQ